MFLTLLILAINFADCQLDDLLGISQLTVISIAMFLLAVFHSSSLFFLRHYQNTPGTIKKSIFPFRILSIPPRITEKLRK